MNKPAIVTIGYNRPDSMRRLLNSVGAAKYPSDEKITLVISIDKSDSEDVVRVASEFDWKHGEKLVLARSERMGLKEHVLACGDLVNEYGSIIVLEDDLFVSPSFYEYSRKALDFTESEERIGGVSLYNHLFNVHARKSFTAIDDGYDNWYFQFASSWGQCYTRQQWNDFRAWLSEHNKDTLVRNNVPANVSGWSEKSWLKFYIAYLIDTDKFFMYPRISYTTNFGDVGSHATKADSDLQVPIAGMVDSLYCKFSRLGQSRAVYDAFFENIYLTGKEGEVLVDLYATKPVAGIIEEDKKQECRRIHYVLSSARLPYKAVKSYGLCMRPVDANIIYEAEGDDICLYDVDVEDKPKPDVSEAEKYLYEYRGISAKQMMSILKYRVDEKIVHRK